MIKICKQIIAKSPPELVQKSKLSKNRNRKHFFESEENSSDSQIVCDACYHPLGEICINRIFKNTGEEEEIKDKPIISMPNCVVTRYHKECFDK
jgi:hypothetical protein